MYMLNWTRLLSYSIFSSYVASIFINRTLSLTVLLIINLLLELSTCVNSFDFKIIGVVLQLTRCPDPSV